VFFGERYWLGYVLVSPWLLQVFLGTADSVSFWLADVDNDLIVCSH
jgi:hypothetical protein